MTILTFFKPPDPDRPPDSGSNLDPDPKHCCQLPIFVKTVFKKPAFVTKLDAGTDRVPVSPVLAGYRNSLLWAASAPQHWETKLKTWFPIGQREKKSPNLIGRREKKSPNTIGCCSNWRAWAPAGPSRTWSRINSKFTLLLVGVKWTRNPIGRRKWISESYWPLQAKSVEHELSRVPARPEED